jgi:serine protease Do
MRKFECVIAGVLLAAGVAAAGAGVEAKSVSVLEETGSAFSQIAKEALPAVVFVRVESTVEVSVPRYHYYDPFGEFFGRRSPHGGQGDPETRKYQQSGQGSGFIISRDGYILTNDHVVKNADTITVILGDGRKFEAVVVGSDPKTEVALIKIEDEADLPFLELGDSDALAVGEWVLAAGNPFGLSQTITAGIVSAMERSEVGITEYADFIQTDAAINPGNSGGPLLNIHGEVVGINTAIYSQSGGYMGIGFAIPINQAVAVKDQLIEHGRVRRSVLGIFIQEVDEALAENFGLEDSGGILISQVMEDSSAEEAGLQSGDIILELNGEVAGKIGSFRSRVAAVPPDTTVELSIFRNGEYINVEAVTKAMDDDIGRSAGWTSTVLEKLGFRVQDLDEETVKQLGGKKAGVMIAEVEEGGIAWKAGLRHGNIVRSVNRVGVENAEQFNRVMESAAGDNAVLLLVADGRGARFVLLPLD